MQLFDEYPYLENETIVIKKMSAADADALSAFAKEEAVYRYLPTFLYEQRYEDARTVLERMDRECFETGESILLGIYVKDEASPPAFGSLSFTQSVRFAGIAEIYNYEEAQAAVSIGCRLARDFWGQGIAAAVLTMLREYLFGQTSVTTITGHIMPANKASAGAAVKSGFVCECRGQQEDWGFAQPVKADKYVCRKDWLADAGSAGGQGETQL